MKKQKIIETIGIQNAITIGLLLLGFAGNYFIMNQKLSTVADGLVRETEQRVLEDKRIEEHVLRLEKSIDGGFNDLKKSIEKMDNTMTYHIGWHSGRDK